MRESGFENGYRKCQVIWVTSFDTAPDAISVAADCGAVGVDLGVGRRPTRSPSCPLGWGQFALQPGASERTAPTVGILCFLVLYASLLLANEIYDKTFAGKSCQELTRTQQIVCTDEIGKDLLKWIAEIGLPDAAATFTK